MLLPPEGRAILEEPYKADITLRNDVKCKVGFTKPSYDVRGSLDTLLVPVRRSGPKGRPVSVAYKTKGMSLVAVFGIMFHLADPPLLDERHTSGHFAYQ